MNKECVLCGEWFTAARKQTRYCDHCRTNMYRSPRAEFGGDTVFMAGSPRNMKDTPSL